MMIETGPEDGLKPLGLKQIDYDTLSIPGRIDIDYDAICCKEQQTPCSIIGAKRGTDSRPDIFSEAHNNIQFPINIRSKDESMDEFLNLDGLYSSKRVRQF